MEWSAGVRGDGVEVVLAGDWVARVTGVEAGVATRVLGAGATGSVSFDAARLGRWDSALILFLSEVRARAAELGMGFDATGLPRPAQRLLGLVAAESAPVAMPVARTGLADRVGRRVMAGLAELEELLALVGEGVLRTVPVLRGRAGLRWDDVMDCAWEAGVAALPIVSVVNLLVGGILAFVGAVQLRRFGAGIYVADLVGLAVVREMAALMTAIIMSGRTGGAYAAHIATMQGNEEIDALRVVGIPVYDYLILPRVMALTVMMPVLYLYGCAVGILGGFGVSLLTLDLSVAGFIAQMRNAVHGDQFVFGLVKSGVFGVTIALAGCRVGLRAGRSAADVGKAATSAVVIGIVSVIALDAVFAVCANALNF